MTGHTASACLCLELALQERLRYAEGGLLRLGHRAHVPTAAQLWATMNPPGHKIGPQELEALFRLQCLTGGSARVQSGGSDCTL